MTVCQPDQDDIAAADARPMVCDDCDGAHCQRSRWASRPDGIDWQSGRCVDFVPFELIDDLDAEDMAGLDDPRSLAALEAMAA